MEQPLAEKIIPSKMIGGGIRSGVILGASTSLGQVLTFACSLLYAAWLSPAALGLYKIIQILVTYMAYSHLGLLSALGREVAIERGRGDMQSAAHVRDVAWTGGLLFTLVVASGYLLLGQAIGGSAELFTDPVLLVLTALFVLVFQGWEYLKAFAAASAQFILRGGLDLMLGILLLVGALILVRPFQVRGVLLSLILARLIVALVARQWLGSWFHVRVDVRQMMQLLRIGFPITLNNFARFVFSTADSLVAAAMLGTLQLGYYALARFGFTALEVIPFAFNVMMATKMAEARGQLGVQDTSYMGWYVEKPTVVMSEMTMILIGGVFLVGPSLIAMFLPKYTPGIVPMQVLALGYFFVTLRILAGSALNVLDRQYHFLAIQVMAIGINLAMSVTLLSVGVGLVGLASSASASAFVMGIAMTLATFRAIYGDLRRCWSYLARLLGTYAVSVAVLLLFRTSGATSSLASAIAVWAVQAMVVLALYRIAFGKDSLIGWTQRWLIARTINNRLSSQ